MPTTMRGVQVPLIARVVLVLVVGCGLLRRLVGGHVVQLLLLLIQVPVHTLLIQPRGC